MAHVKVVRRSMGKGEWIKLRADWLSRRIVKRMVETSNWEVREARQVGEMEYEFYDEGFHPINQGDRIFTPDGTSFLKVATQIPEELKGEEVWFQLETAAEMMVKANGKWAGGIDPNRHRILISPYVDALGNINIEIEGYNRSKPDDERNPQSSALRGCTQIFSGGSFVVIDNEIEAASYDVKILLDTMEAESINEDIRNFIRDELDKALNLVDYEEEDEAIYSQSIKALREYIKTNIFDNKNFKGNGKVALVSHSHLDLAYYWKRVHTIQKNARTCLIQLRLMDKYPEFKYCHTQAYTYETLEKYYPEVFEELKERIKEGRFEIAGAMYVEPDCNIPTAEALVRQCLYGQHYFRSRFGKTIENCWLPDVFGNSWILPQILKKSGVKYFLSNKMSTWNDTNRFPHNHFLWKGIDGSEVYACVPPTHFITWNTPQQITENWESFQDKDVCEETLNMFGYGDGGSGATEQMLQYARRMNSVPGVPETRHIRGDEFLRDNFENNDSLAVWDGELYLEMHRGTFTTKGQIKKINRELEILLRDTELLCSIASTEGFLYPYEELTEAWKKVLINQFHDILPGTHIAPVTVDTLKDYDEVGKTLNSIIHKAARYLGLAEAVEGESELQLLNTLSWERKGPVFIQGKYLDKSISNGLPAQNGSCRGVEGLWFDADSIPGLSYKTITIKEAEKETIDTHWFSLKDNILDTPYYKAVLLEDGSLQSLILKEEERELVAEGSTINNIRIYRDNPGMYDAWDILPNYKDREDKLELLQSLTLEENGEVFVSFAVKHKTKNSVWKQTIRFFNNNPRIEFENEVDWNETNRMAKAEFNLNILTRHAKCDTSAGAITRETHRNTTWQQSRFEVCHHKWADLSEAGFGVALINDGKYGISLEENTMGLTLLRSSIRPDVYSDKGRHSFTYALLPHKGSPEEGGINEAAWQFNVPLKVFSAGTGKVDTLMKLSPDNLHLQAVKKTEGEERERSFIVRFAELHGKRGKGVYSFNKEIKQAFKVNLLEDEEKQAGFKVEKGELNFDYKPYEILSFKIVV
jgi:alpha-mannosidase